VVWSEDPQHAAKVVWDGNTVDEEAVLLYGTAPGKCSLNAPLTEAGRYGSSKDAATKHREIHYLNREQHGPEILYFSGEGIWQVTRWKNGEKDGNLIKFEDDGSRKEYTYVNDERGEVIHSNFDGSVREADYNED
jgi:antitoxin component YwqK of YwqJK toxin-antitoxin module